MSGLESDNRDISSSKVGGRIGGGLNRDDDEDQEGEEDDHDHDGMQGGGPRNNKNKNKNKRRGYGCGGDFSKARGVVLFPFTKAKKLLKKKSDNRPSSSSSSLSSRVAVTVGGRIGGGLNRDDDEDQEGEENDHDHDGMQGGGPRNNKNKNKNKRRGYGCGGDFSKARGVVLFPFTKAKKLLKKKSDKRPSSSSSSLSSRVAVTGKNCFCLKQNFTLQSPTDSQTSDPNHPKFTFEMLRTLIEKNDFYSKECNTR
ncbi:conserved hypothetical protein [Ricinus communis]|uniref:Uncharacterized protein n=1 Tax=Ricinus communis TaxID=3988 RepID=B9RFS8_RICCO|nr:conserved hypothetical protein [Ricinus communis]